MYMYLRTCTYMCTYIRILLYICTAVYIYNYIYTYIYICPLHTCINNQSIHPLEATKISPYAVDDEQRMTIVFSGNPMMPWADPR